MSGVQSLASYLLCLAVSWARGAVGVQRAVVGYLLTLHRSQLGFLRHQHTACSRWLLTHFASQSVWLFAPSTCSEQSLATYLHGLAVSWARGAIHVQ